MRTDRRGFLRLAGGALGLRARPSRAAAPAHRLGPAEIHIATRNTRSGALGAALLRLRPTGPPFKPYAGRQRLALPREMGASSTPLAEALARGAGGDGFAGTALSRASFARHLHLANGVTGTLGTGPDALQLRAAPSAGALYAGEVYVAVARVEGLAPGLYYYAVQEHALVPLRDGSPEARVAAAVERPAELAGAAFHVLLTNVFARYSQRYLDRGYRYALIDSGHIGENLRAAAAAEGLRVASPLRFHDDALGALLGIDGREEAVCALHAVGAPGRGAEGASEGSGPLAEKQLAAPDEVPRRAPLPERYHEATKLVPAPERTGPRGDGAVPPATPRDPGPTRPLAAPLAPVSASADSAIAGRRSARRFLDEPIALAELGFVTRQAVRSARPDTDLGILFAAHRVRDLPSGLYRLRPDGEAAELRRVGDLGSPLARVCLGQEKAEQAAVAFLMTVDLARAAARGARRYRDLLLEAGAIGQRIYLAAEAFGLVARNLAAFIDDELDRLLELDIGRERVVHLTLLGRGR